MTSSAAHLILILLVLCIWRLGADQLMQRRDFCLKQKMNITCSQNEVIVMESARFGRMQSGSSCITGRYKVGCHTSVLAHLHSLCSGKRSCMLPVIRLEDVAQPCPELKSYLAVAYRCIKATYDDFCEPDRPSSVQYLTSTAIQSQGHGSSSCPWLIHVAPGQRIELSMEDFSRPSLLSETRLASPTCPLYSVFVQDGKAKANIPVCARGQRGGRLFTSVTNEIAVIVSAQVQQLRKPAPRFLLKYTVVGCRTLVVPRLAWSEIRDDTAVVKCNHTGETWFLSCKGNSWLGALGNCSQAHPHPSVVSHVDDKRPGFPFGEHQTVAKVNDASSSIGIVVAVVIGIGLGVGIGLTLLGFIYCCRQKKPGKNRSGAMSRPPGGVEGHIYGSSTPAPNLVPPQHECKNYDSVENTLLCKVDGIAVPPEELTHHIQQQHGDNGELIPCEHHVPRYYDLENEINAHVHTCGTLRQARTVMQ